jgi:hypothetical protein
MYANDEWRGVGCAVISASIGIRDDSGRYKNSNYVDGDPVESCRA